MASHIDLSTDLVTLKERAAKFSERMTKLETRMLNALPVEEMTVQAMQDEYSLLSKLQMEMLEFIRKWTAMKIESAEDPELIAMARRLKEMTPAELEKMKRSMIQVVSSNGESRVAVNST